MTLGNLTYPKAKTKGKLKLIKKFKESNLEIEIRWCNFTFWDSFYNLKSHLFGLNVKTGFGKIVNEKSFTSIECVDRWKARVSE